MMAPSTTSLCTEVDCSSWVGKEPTQDRIDSLVESVRHFLAQATSRFRPFTQGCRPYDITSVDTPPPDGWIVLPENEGVWPRDTSALLEENKPTSYAPLPDQANELSVTAFKIGPVYDRRIAGTDESFGAAVLSDSEPRGDTSGRSGEEGNEVQQAAAAAEEGADIWSLESATVKVYTKVEEGLPVIVGVDAGRSMAGWEHERNPTVFYEVDSIWRDDVTPPSLTAAQMELYEEARRLAQRLLGLQYSPNVQITLVDGSPTQSENGSQTDDEGYSND